MVLREYTIGGMSFPDMMVDVALFPGMRIGVELFPDIMGVAFPDMVLLIAKVGGVPLVLEGPLLSLLRSVSPLARMDDTSKMSGVDGARRSDRRGLVPTALVVHGVS